MASIRNRGSRSTNSESNSSTMAPSTSEKSQVQAIPTSEPPKKVLPVNIAFYIVAVSHVAAALFAPIQDCDETFNYWEPLHYLVHGYGKETWEYSPDYAIRSWAYVFLHSIPTKFFSIFGNSKVAQFYLLRCIFALCLAGAETKLYRNMIKTLDPRIGAFYILISAFTPGFYYASTSFLPSSFAMITNTMGLAAFMSHRGSAHIASGIFWFGTGALIGWPFSAVCLLPFIAEDWIVGFLSDDIVGTLQQYIVGAARLACVLVFQMFVDAFFYRRVVFVPWQIFKYNVFGGDGRGPDLFGTEPWTFYGKNLFLNFNIWFLLAIAIGPLLLTQFMHFKQQTSPQTLIRTAVFNSPLYLWLIIFTAQPHKEERFMYPIYPFIALAASLSLYKVLGFLGAGNSLGQAGSRLKFFFALAWVGFSISVGLLRIIGTTTAYGAPLSVYKGLNTQVLTPTDTVCLGKDWYRFPTSFHLPRGVHAKFIRSEFDGLLPGDFSENPREGTWTIPDGMNDLNIEDSGKYTSIDKCTFLVDSSYPSTKPSSLEPNYAESPKWEKVKCAPILDTKHTNLFARTLWLPEWLNLPGLNRVWGEHCLLRQTKA